MPSNPNTTAAGGASHPGAAGTGAEATSDAHSGSGKAHCPACAVPHCPLVHEVDPSAHVTHALPQSAADEHTVPNWQHDKHA
jgi:hypothetical protein